MQEFTLDISGWEIVRWVKEEKSEAGGYLDFYEEAEVEYLMEEEFDRMGYGVRDGEDYDLISFKAVLDIEPRVEQNYWILQVQVKEALGPRPKSEEDLFATRELTVEEFESEFLPLGEATVTVKVWTETPNAKEHFDDWFARMKTKHQKGPAATGRDGLS